VYRHCCCYNTSQVSKLAIEYSPLTSGICTNRSVDQHEYLIAILLITIGYVGTKDLAVEVESMKNDPPRAVWAQDKWTRLAQHCTSHVRLGRNSALHRLTRLPINKSEAKNTLAQQLEGANCPQHAVRIPPGGLSSALASSPAFVLVFQPASICNSGL
jgi:hypothetical protein